MRTRLIITGLIGSFLLSSCGTAPGVLSGNYDYELGLGYGFLGKQVQVSVDGTPVLFLVANEEMEAFAQMQGTNMLYFGKSKQEQITVSVSVDGDPPMDQVINLGEGKYIHIYLDETGLSIYNTPILIYE